MKKTLLLSLILIAAAASVFGQGFSDMAGNPKCSDFGFASETKIDPPQAGTYQVAGIGGSVVGTVTITINSSHTASWTASGNIIGAVIMKGGPAGRLARTPLHAAELSFTDPRTGERRTFKTPLLDDHRRALEVLRVVAAREAARDREGLASLDRAEGTRPGGASARGHDDGTDRPADGD